MSIDVMVFFGSLPWLLNTT